MKRFFCILILLTNTLSAGWFDWLTSNDSKAQQFDCPHQCGTWGSESIHEVEWQFILCLWELDRLSAATLDTDFLFSKPINLQDPWYQKFLDEDLALLSKSNNEYVDRLYWEIVPIDEDGIHKGKEFFWTYYTDAGSENSPADWDGFRIDSLSALLEALRTIEAPGLSMFGEFYDHDYPCYIKSCQNEIERLESILSRNQSTLVSKINDLETARERSPTATNYLAEKEKKIETLENLIVKNEARLANETAQLAKLEAEYTFKIAAYNQYYPLVQAQMHQVKKAYTDIFHRCIEQHESPSAYYERSRVNFLDGFYMDCLEDLRKLLEITTPEMLNEKIDDDPVLRKGSIESQLGLFDDAIQTLSSYLQENPRNKEAYFERAVAYFEMGDFESSLADFLQSEKKVPIYVGSYGIEFCTGLIHGICMSAGETFVDFVPSTLSSLNGLAHGLWAFTCNPEEVSVQMFHACGTMINFLTDHSALETLQALIPEVKELTDKSKELSDRRKGELIGSIIGRYGTDFLLYAGIGKGVKAFTDLRKANQLLTLEKMTKDAARWTTLEELHQAWWKRTKTILDDVKKSNGAKFDRLIGQTFKNECLSEIQVRQVLHHCGFKTFSRPKGIPHNWEVQLSKSGGGMKYRLSTIGKGEKIYVKAEVRVMPGNPNSSNPLQQKPYVKHSVNGQHIDKKGNIVGSASPEAHIPLYEYDFEKLSGLVPYE